MQKQIQICLLLVGIVLSSQVVITPVAVNELQKGELKVLNGGEKKDGFDAIFLIKKMISDLETKDRQLNLKASTDLKKCQAPIKALFCVYLNNWKNSVNGNNRNIAALQKKNRDNQDDILQLQAQIRKETEDFNKAELKAKQQVKDNFEHVINLIKKIIKLMVSKYQVKTVENLNGVFLEENALEQLKEQLNDEQNTNSFGKIELSLIQQTVQSMTDKRYDTDSAQRFVKLMEALIVKLRSAMAKFQNERNLSKSKLNASIAKLNARINALKQQVKQNNARIVVSQKDNARKNKRIYACRDSSQKMQKCSDKFLAQKLVADADDDLIKLLNQVLIDTSDLMGVNGTDAKNEAERRKAEIEKKEAAAKAAALKAKLAKQAAAAKAAAAKAAAAKAAALKAAALKAAAAKAAAAKKAAAALKAKQAAAALKAKQEAARLAQKYQDLGSYKDTGNRALRYGPMKYGYTADTCQKACPQYKYFALQNNGWCCCDNDLTHATKYGKTTCGKKGGPWCNYIYQNLKYEDKTTRYVKVVNGKNGPIQIAQLQVYDDKNVERARGKPTSASSTHSATKSSTAVDGTASARSHPHIFHSAIYTAGQYWQVDLQQSYNVKRVVYYNRKDCCAERSVGMVIQLLSSQKKVTKSYTLRGGSREEARF